MRARTERLKAPGLFFCESNSLFFFVKYSIIDIEKRLRKQAIERREV